AQREPALVVLLLDDRRELDLLLALGGAPGILKPAVSSQGSQALQLLETRHPAGADGLGDDPGQARAALQEPPTLGDRVRLVGEPVRPELVEVAKDSCLEDLRVELGDAVHTVTADDSQVRHAHTLLGPLLDDGHPLATRIIVTEASAHEVQE